MSSRASPPASTHLFRESHVSPDRAILPPRQTNLFAVFLAGLTFAAPAVCTGASQQPPPGASGAASPAQATQSPATQPNAKPEPPPVTKDEEDAFQAIASLKTSDSAQIVTLSQGFLSKYALSTYRPAVYARLVVSFMNTQQLDKLVSAGQSALREDPDNLPVLSVMSSILPRMHPHALDAPQRLDLAERYARRALQLGSNMTKPEGMSEEQFAGARNENLAMAHAGLGLVYYRRGDTAASTSELDQATKLDPRSDPIEYYLLGDGLMKLQKFSEAASAFDHCARAQWGSDWQQRCKDGQSAAAKASATPHPPGAKP